MAEVQDRRDIILSAAAEIFARKGISAATVREIADAAGVLSGSLYHHFDSKDSIVEEILTTYLDAIRARYAEVLANGKPSAQALHELVLASLEVAEQQPNATAIYQNELHYLREQPRFKHVLSAAADVQKTWMQVIEAGVADGSFRGDIPARVFYRLIRDAVWLSVRWHKPNRSYSTKHLARDTTSIFLNGFAADGSAAPADAARPATDAARGRTRAR